MTAPSEGAPKLTQALWLALRALVYEYPLTTTGSPSMDRELVRQGLATHDAEARLVPTGKGIELFNARDRAP